MDNQHNPYHFQIELLQKQLAETALLLSDPEMASLAKDEHARLTKEIEQLEDAAREFSSLTEESVTETRHSNCTFEIRGGAGGDEAKIWANDLLRMYMRFSETIGLQYEVIDDLVVKFKGKTRSIPRPDDSHDYFTAYELFQYESGVHRVQRVPATESQGRIHTSTASIAVLPEVSAKIISVREEDVEWQFMRSSGAGGQSVNKTNSAVRLIHHPSGIVVTARQERKQSQNRQIAMELLRSQLWEIEEEKRLTTLGNARAAIGRARRAEKIRTYNYPQNRITDHRTKQSWHNLSLAIDGDLSLLISELHAEMAKDSGEAAVEIPE